MENIIKELQNELRTRFFMDGENHPKISAVKVYRFTDERMIIRIFTLCLMEC